MGGGPGELSEGNAMLHDDVSLREGVLEGLEGGGWMDFVLEIGRAHV